MSAYLSRSVLRPIEPRYIGFLNSNRKLLALGAIAASGLLTSIPALPASADFVAEETVVASLQTYESPAVYVEPAVIRDSFGITSYTLVQWPVPATTTVSDYFGWRSCAGCSEDHLGVDLTPGNGYPIQVVADGTVIEAQESNDGLGVHVIVEHVIDGVVYDTLYAHMQFGSLAVSVGQAVARGTQLGVVGNTGSSTGPHLHFGVLYNKVEIDPYAWLQQHANV